MTTLWNWNRSAGSHPRVVVDATSVDHVVQIVRDRATYPSPVRAAGELHSTTACIEADGGTQVRMRGLAHVRVEDGGRRITVGAGATMLAVRDELRKHGRELAVSPEIGNATAGSVACGGSKDSWLHSRSYPEGLAQIGSAVVAVTLVDAQGELVTVDERSGPGGLSLELVRCSYGLLGIIVEVTFATVPRALLANRFAWLPVASTFDPAQEDHIAVPTVAEIFAGADAVLAFLQPYHGGVLIERRTAIGDDKITPEDQMRREVRDWIWEWGASGATTLLAGMADVASGSPAKGAARMAAASVELLSAALLENRLTRALFAGHPPSPTLGRAFAEIHERLPRETRTPPPDVDPSSEEAQFARLLPLFDKPTGPFFEDLVRGYRAYRSDSLVDFSHDRATFFDFTFWAFAERHWDRLVPEYIRFCRDYSRRHGGYRPALFTEIYFIPQDRHSLLSFSADGPVFTLDMVDNRPDDARWRAMNRAYNLWAAEHGGHPLMNQTKELEATPEVLSRAYGEAWARFSRAVWAANPAAPDAPDGRFVSSYFKKLLTPPVGREP